MAKKTNALITMVKTIAADALTKIVIKLLDDKISDEECAEAGFKLGVLITSNSNKAIKNWEQIEAINEKKVSSFMAGLKLGVDSDDEIKR